MSVAASDRVIVVNVLDVLKLVQQAWALAYRTDDDMLKGVCNSLCSVLVWHDIKKIRATIPRFPHEQQLMLLESVLAKEQ